MLVKEIFNYIENYLNKIDINEFDRNDLYVICEYVFKVDINKLYMNDYNVDVTKYKLEKLRKCLKAYYIDFIPLAYVTKFQKFYNEKYYIDNNVLVPRYDTEILVDTAIRYIRDNNINYMLDMCTGSGCIGISIAKNSNIKKVYMVDISSAAVKVANKNIKLNNVNNKCETICSDLFKNVSKKSKVSLIVSNPPYIKLKDKNILSKYVNKEPEIALFGGDTGMDFYKRILADAVYYLEDNSFIIFEIGYDELRDIKNLISKYKFYDIIETVKDIEKRDRVVVCHFHQI